MFKADKLTKSFDGKPAVHDISFTMQSHTIYGLLGSNGAGKSTLMRLLCGIYKPDSGTVFYDGESVYDNPNAKHKMFFVPDTPFYYPDFDMAQMGEFYKTVYKSWSDQLYHDLLRVLDLPEHLSMHKFSKGMLRQAALVYGLSTLPNFLLMDEAFDGLDPIMRQAVRKHVIRQVAELENTVLISSHNLREMEDFCDHVIFLHRGEQILTADMDDLRQLAYKVQIVWSPKNKPEIEKLPLNIQKLKRQGVLETYIIKNSEDEIRSVLSEFSPVVLEIIPLTLEEVFFYELARKEYAVENLIGW